MNKSWVSETMWMGIVAILAAVLVAQVTYLFYLAPTRATISLGQGIGLVLLFLGAAFLTGCGIRGLIYLFKNLKVKKPVPPQEPATPTETPAETSAEPPAEPPAPELPKV